MRVLGRPRTAAVHAESQQRDVLARRSEGAAARRDELTVREHRHSRDVATQARSQEGHVAHRVAAIDVEDDALEPSLALEDHDAPVGAACVVKNGV